MGMQTCTCSFLFFFNDTATTEIYTLSLHDALPISGNNLPLALGVYASFFVLALVATLFVGQDTRNMRLADHTDRKSTRLNSSHANISYAVFCLKKKHSPTSSPCALHVDLLTSAPLR